MCDIFIFVADNIRGGRFYCWQNRPVDVGVFIKCTSVIFVKKNLSKLLFCACYCFARNFSVLFNKTFVAATCLLSQTTRRCLCVKRFIKFDPKIWKLSWCCQNKMTACYIFNLVCVNFLYYKYE